MARKISELNVGDRVRFGSYSVNGEGTHKIVWIKANGDNTFISERIEDFRAFDAKEKDNPDANRRRYGNNHYSISNIDQFLNSSEDACCSSKRHEYDEPPTEGYVSGNTEYAEHHGFLRYFDGWEIDAIDDSTITTALPDCDVQNDEHFETITRKVFLPSITNIFGKTIRGVSEGDYWDYFRRDMYDDRVTTPNYFAVENSSIDEEVDEDNAWYWLLRSPNAGSGYGVQYVGRDGGYNYCNACFGILGVRPALKINPEILVSDEPDDMGYYDVIQTEIAYEDVSEDELFSILTK